MQEKSYLVYIYVCVCVVVPQVWGVGGSPGYSCELRDLFLVFVVCNVHCFDEYLCCICVCSCVCVSSTSQLQGFLSSVVFVRCQIVSIGYRIGVQLLVCMLQDGIGSFFSLSCFLLSVHGVFFLWVKDALHFPLRKNALIFLELKNGKIELRARVNR